MKYIDFVDREYLPTDRNLVCARAVMAEMSLEDYAGDHVELGKALETWSKS